MSTTKAYVGFTEPHNIPHDLNSLNCNSVHSISPPNKTGTIHLMHLWPPKPDQLLRRPISIFSRRPLEYQRIPCLWLLNFSFCTCTYRLRLRMDTIFRYQYPCCPLCSGKLDPLGHHCNQHFRTNPNNR